MANDNAVRLTPEGVAYWYLRLNGFFQMRSFIVHPSRRGAQRTDADLIGVRFPHRAELHFDDPDNIMQDDDPALGDDKNTTSIWIVEVKTNQPCSLNGPWSNADSQNVHRVMAAIGCFQIGEISDCANAIYSTGSYVGSGGEIVRLVCIGREKNADLARTHSDVTQITWHDALAFIGNRLNQFHNQKAQVEQWDGEIHQLQDLVRQHRYRGEFDIGAFLDASLRAIGVQP